MMGGGGRRKGGKARLCLDPVLNQISKQLLFVVRKAVSYGTFFFFLTAVLLSSKCLFGMDAMIHFLRYVTTMPQSPIQRRRCSGQEATDGGFLPAAVTVQRGLGFLSKNPSSTRSFNLYSTDFGGQSLLNIHLDQSEINTSKCFYFCSEDGFDNWSTPMGQLFDIAKRKGCSATQF
jgi:hypothetical protein